MSRVQSSSSSSLLYPNVVTQAFGSTLQTTQHSLIDSSSMQVSLPTPSAVAHFSDFFSDQYIIASIRERLLRNIHMPVLRMDMVNIDIHIAVWETLTDSAKAAAERKIKLFLNDLWHDIQSTIGNSLNKHHLLDLILLKLELSEKRVAFETKLIEPLLDWPFLYVGSLNRLNSLFTSLNQNYDDLLQTYDDLLKVYNVADSDGLNNDKNLQEKENIQKKKNSLEERHTMAVNRYRQLLAEPPFNHGKLVQLEYNSKQPFMLTLIRKLDAAKAQTDHQPTTEQEIKAMIQCFNEAINAASTLEQVYETIFHKPRNTVSSLNDDCKKFIKRREELEILQERYCLEVELGYKDYNMFIKYAMNAWDGSDQEEMQYFIKKGVQLLKFLLKDEKRYTLVLQYLNRIKLYRKQ